MVLARRLAFTLNFEIVRSARSVNLKKSDSPYKGIDALVWSIAFAEKVHRYADEVYLFGEYLVKNFEHMQRHTYEDLIDGIVEFDPYLIDPRYRQKIEAINPPLPAE